MIYILLTWILTPVWWPLAQVRKLLNPAPRRILIAEIAGIGDVVCSTAVFKAVRARFPDAHIALMVDTVVYKLASQDPAIDEVKGFAYGGQKGLKGRLSLMRYFVGIDTFICLIPSAAQLSAACWAATPRRYTVLPDVPVTSYNWLAPLMTHSLKHRTGTNFVDAQLQLLKPLGVDGKPEDRAVKVTDEARQIANSMIRVESSCAWVGIAVGSGQGIKALDPGTLQRLIERLLANPRLGVVLLGGAKESALAESLCSSIADRSRCLNAAGKVTLDQLPGLLARLAIFVGVDSGVTYMADALGVPLVYIPGPASPADQGPIRAKRIDLNVPLDCAPCSRIFVTPKTCKTGSHLCTRSFTERDIAAAVLTLLEESA